MDKILDTYGYGIIQDCKNLIQSLEKVGVSQIEFLDFVEKARKSAPEKPSVKKVGKIKKVVFLKPGETEKMEGVICEKCQGVIYIEGLCVSNPLVKKGFVRKGICGSCGNEFGIR